MIHIPCGFVKIMVNKIFHFRTFKASPICAISPLTEITLEHGAELSLGRKFKMRDGAKLRVRKGSKCKIGNNVLINSNNIIACHENVVIGDGVQLSPGVQIYDHDHDFRTEVGIGSMDYKSAPVIIGNNVWIGANSIILRGSVIGDNCVVAAGSIIKGVYPSNLIIYQKREIATKVIEKDIERGAK